MTNDNPHSPQWLTCDLDCDLCVEMEHCPLINPDEMTTRIMTSKHRGFKEKGKKTKRKRSKKKRNKKDQE